MKITELNNFTFVEFDKGTTGKHHDTQECYMFINKSKNTTYRISFSMAVSEIVKKKELTKLVLKIDNITGDVYILFSDDPTRKSPTLKFKENKNGLSQMSVSCAEMYKYIKDTLGLENKVELSGDLAKSDDYATFKILK